MNTLKKSLTTERGGFTITFEIAMTILLVCTAIVIMMVLVQAGSMKKFMLDVVSSTATVASRYGGDNSPSYQIQVVNASGKSTGGATSISANANAIISEIANNNSKLKGGAGSIFVRFEPVGDDGKYVTVSDVSELKNDNMVKVDFNYRTTIGNQENSWLGGDPVNNHIELPSLMQSGKLLNGS